MDRQRGAFGLTDRGPQTCELNFRHTGITRELVTKGWEHFLASLAAYAEHGTGSPAAGCRSRCWRVRAKVAGSG
jgi:hypothetical protein